MHDTQPLITELQTILHAEIAAYQHLVELQQAEKRHLAARALEPFLTNLHAKEHRLRAVRRLEQKRQDMLQRLGPRLGFADARVTLQQLSTRVPEPFATALLHTRAQLREVVDTLRQCNQENVRLLQESLVVIDETLAFFSALVPQRPTYQRSGAFMPPTQGRFLSGRV